MSRVLSMQQNELPGEPLSLRGVLFPFYFTLHCFVGTWAYAPQAGSLLIFLIVIQPFANEIRRYICQDRHEECHEDLQCSSPPSTAKESAAETVYQTCPDSTRFAARRKRKSHLIGTHRRTFPAVGPFVMRYHQTKTRWHKIARLFPQCMLNWKNTPQQR